MFLNSKSLKPSKLTDATLPSATFFKFDENDTPTFGLLGTYNDEIHVVPVEGEYQFEKLDTKDGLFQKRYHLLFPNIKFEFNYESYYQTSTSNIIKIGSLVRTGSELQIITKSINEAARPAVTLTNGYENLGDYTVYFSKWAIYFKDELDWKKIWEEPNPNHPVELNS